MTASENSHKKKLFAGKFLFEVKIAPDTPNRIGNRPKMTRGGENLGYSD